MYFGGHDASLLNERGADVGMALLLEYYHKLPQPRAGEGRAAWAVRMESGLEDFARRVQARYGEGTLQRLLRCPDVDARRAAVLALRLLGTMDSNEAVAAMLRDEDEGVRQLAADALWALWFRADSAAHNHELQRILKQSAARRLAALNALIVKAPSFAEAYNQRAIVYFSAGDYPKSIADCERVLKLNPVHFGALSGMAQCHLRLRNGRAALQAFRRVHTLFPGMEGIEETIRALEEALGEEGRRDDRK
jgi:tetratricopeptide (TPR) repeat protein